MFPEWSEGTWWLVIVGGNIAAVAGLICLYAVMTYFFGDRVGEASFWIVGIPLWLEVLAISAAAFAAALVIAAVLLAFIAVILVICGVCWVLTWPWRHRYRRLFHEYIGFDPKVKRELWRTDKWQRKVDRRLKEYAVALQDVLDQLDTEVREYVRSSLERDVSRARKSFALAQKAVHECGFWVKPSHVYYLPKRRREKMSRPLKVVA